MSPKRKTKRRQSGKWPTISTGGTGLFELYRDAGEPRVPPYKAIPQGVSGFVGYGAMGIFDGEQPKAPWHSTLNANLLVNIEATISIDGSFMLFSAALPVEVAHTGRASWIRVATFIDDDLVAADFSLDDPKCPFKLKKLDLTAGESICIGFVEITEHKK